ncbi:hypothetical protein N8602_00055 [bacterium]|nr:hypothetical protein [bacterium]
MTGWRNCAQKMLANMDITALDPTRRVSFHDELYLGEQHTPVQSTCRRIFKMDMQDIANSNVVLADIRRNSGRGTGTAMELMFAHMKNKIIILWANKDDHIHPFYESIYTEKHFYLEDCIDAISYYY